MIDTLVLENERRHVCGCKNIFGLKLQMGRVGQVETKTTESKLELKVSLVVQPFLFSPVLPLWVSGLHLAAGVHLELEHGHLDHLEVAPSPPSLCRPTHGHGRGCQEA